MFQNSNKKLKHLVNSSKFIKFFLNLVESNAHFLVLDHFHWNRMIDLTLFYFFFLLFSGIVIHSLHALRALNL